MKLDLQYHFVEEEKMIVPVFEQKRLTSGYMSKLTNRCYFFQSSSQQVVRGAILQHQICAARNCVFLVCRLCRAVM